MNEIDELFGEEKTQMKTVNSEGEVTDITPEKAAEIADAMNKFAIRKLIPEECFILMGMTAEDCRKARAVGVSDSQLYKQAGNGLISSKVQFIMQHLKKMYKPDYITTDEKMVERYGLAE